MALQVLGKLLVSLCTWYHLWTGCTLSSCCTRTLLAFSILLQTTVCAIAAAILTHPRPPTQAMPVCSLLCYVFLSSIDRSCIPSTYAFKVWDMCNNLCCNMQHRYSQCVWMLPVTLGGNWVVSWHAVISSEWNHLETQHRHDCCNLPGSMCLQHILQLLRHSRARS